jgi:hypothetical protein
LLEHHRHVVDFEPAPAETSVRAQYFYFVIQCAAGLDRNSSTGIPSPPRRLRDGLKVLVTTRMNRRRLLQTPGQLGSLSPPECLRRFTHHTE